MSLQDKRGDQSPSVGRYQAQQILIGPSCDLKGAPGDLWRVPVVHAKIEIMGFGYSVNTALGGSTTINSIVNLDKQLKDNGARAIVNALGTLTFDGVTPNVLASFQQVDLNVNATAAATAAAAGPPSRPTAVFGDQLVLELLTAGTGAAAQTVTPFIIFRERTQ